MSITKIQIDKMIEIAKQFGATKVLLFGSALDDPENANDLDIGVLGVHDNKFFLFGGILNEILKINVDVIPLNTVLPFVDYIKKHGQYLYEA
jgi:uncharacterized protein